MPISLAFLGSALVVIVTPGPDLALLTGILVRTGRRAPALSAAAGMTLAGGGYALLAITGVANLIAHRPAFAAGFASTAVNPKVGLFLLAFLPQFLPADRPSATAMALLAMLYLALVALWLGVYIMVAYRVARLLAGAPAQRILQAVTGCLLVGLAARLALA